MYLRNLGGVLVGGRVLERMRIEIVRSLHSLKYWSAFRAMIIFSVDSSLVILAVYLSFVMRLDSWNISPYSGIFGVLGIGAACISSILGYIFGIYRVTWRHANLSSVIQVAYALLLTSLGMYVIDFIGGASLQMPRSLPPIFWLVSLLLLVSYKFIWRYLARYQSKPKGRPRCMIYGAGQSGQLLAKHLIESNTSPYELVGFIDDDQTLTRRTINGIRVYAGTEGIGETLEKNKIEYVLVAIHSAPGEKLQTILRKVPNMVKTLIMPHLTDSLQSDILQLRPVDIKDLLRRSPKSEEAPLPNEFKGKTILVTGSGGSIGSELCRQILRLSPAEILLLDVCEFNLYKIESELQHVKKSTHITPILTSVVSLKGLRRAFSGYEPDIVIHAAAYKHVPLVEINKEEAILNNVLGTRNILDLVVEFGVEKFMLVSTDKAVNPTNIMGSTKRVCELLVQSYEKNNTNKETKFSIVRFGNVLGSSGSVIPMFMEQIKQGGPLTVTHSEVTRYFMLIEEAVLLILKALSLSKGGETFILDMGKPVRILDMANQLIRLSGKEPGKDISIKITGLRPGEKLYEELLLVGSETHTKFDNLLIARPEKVDAEGVLADVAKMIELAELSNPECIAILRKLALYSSAGADSYVEVASKTPTRETVGTLSYR